MDEKLVEIMNEIKELESKIRLATPELQKVLFLLHKMRVNNRLYKKKHSHDLI